MRTSPVVQIPRLILRRLERHALAGAPDEVCGLLAGVVSQGGSGPRTIDVLEFFPIPNADRSATTFRMEPHRRREAEIEIHRAALGVVGFFHSHPTSAAYPSETDVERAHWEGTDDLLHPEAVHAIISLADPASPELRFFRLLGRRIPQDIDELAVQSLPP